MWVTGRAAAGKTTVVEFVRAALTEAGQDPVVLCDEQLLRQLAREDVSHSHHWHPHGDQHIALRDGWLFDEGLRIIGRNVLNVIDHGDSVRHG
jgi:adenylylsulfate kinase-like enzyme